jgi:hypothetical protein
MSQAALSFRRRTAVAAASMATFLVGTLAGCGSNGTQATPAAPTPGAGPGGPQGRQVPGVSGLIAAVSGRTLQVQGGQSQAAVTYTAKTSITEVTPASATALKVGLCAAARAVPGATPLAAQVVAAGSVTVSDPVKGSCALGFSGLGGGRPGDAGSGFPRANPSGAPGGGGSGPSSIGPQPGGVRRGSGLAASGKVVSVRGAAFEVETAEAGSTAKINVHVTVTSSTTWSRLKKVNAKGVAVGKCVTAFGKSGATGALTATSLSLRASTNGTCSNGFGGGRQRPNGPGGTPSSGGTHG